MTTGSAALPSAQLIYTNVEADESPTGRRGFQVWLASPSLPEPLRRDIAKRLGDFKAPAGLNPGETIRRHVYFSCAEAGERFFVLAQTVPLAEKDMFGRGGRFYAHAFVLAEEEFAGVGCNPFALLDGGPGFATSLAEGKAAAPQWRQGVAPDVELELSPISANAAAPPLLLREFVSYLEKSEYLPVAIPQPTGGGLAFLRALFHWLPPSLRRGESFSMLSPGPTLWPLPYRFAAALSIADYRACHSPAPCRLCRESCHRSP